MNSTRDTGELSEKDILSMKGDAYDIPADDGMVYRHLKDWYLTQGDSIIRRDLEPLDGIIIKKQERTKPYILHGRLVSQRKGYDDVPIRIHVTQSWAIERESTLRGVWIQSHHVWYWLKQPSDMKPTFQVQVIAGGTALPIPLSATLESQEELHTELRAKLGLISNLCDVFFFDSTTMDNREESLELLKRHTKMTPDALHAELKPSPELLTMFPGRPEEPFDLDLLQRYAVRFVKEHMNGCHDQFPSDCVFMNHLSKYTSRRVYTRDEFMVSALAAEQRGGRYPWGELKPTNDSNNNDTSTLSSSATTSRPRINPNWVYDARLQIAAAEQLEKRKQIKETARRPKKRRVDTQELTNPFDEEKVEKKEEIPNPEEVDHEAHVRKLKKRRRRIADDDEHEEEGTSTLPEIPEVPEAIPISPAGEAILSKVTFQPRRMNQALKDMQSFLNKDPTTVSTLAEVQRAGYSFKDVDALVQFIKAKMKKSSSIMTWEYKVLVALLFTGIYKEEQNVVKKGIMKLQKSIFAKSGDDNETAAKILVETWRREAIELITSFDRVSGRGGTEHPLKATLVVELLIEISIFCTKLKGLEKKKQLDRMRELYDIGLVEGNAETRDIAKELNNARLIHFSSGAKMRLEYICSCVDDHESVTAEAVTEATPRETVPLPRKTAKDQLASAEVKKAADDERRRKLWAKFERKTQSSIGRDVIDNKAIEPAGAVQGPRSEKSAIWLPNISDMNKEKTSLGTSAAPLGPAISNNDHKCVWGEKSAWSSQNHGERQPVAAKVDVSDVESLALWIGSSKRTTYCLWGGAGEAQPAPQQPSLEVNNIAYAPASGTQNLITQTSHKSNYRSSQGSAYMDGNGYGSHNNTSSWTDEKNNGKQDQPSIPCPPVALQNANIGNTMALPNGRRGGLGRGAGVNKPSWMTHGKLNSVEHPAQQDNNYSIPMHSHVDNGFGMPSVDYASSQMNSTNIPSPGLSTSQPNAVQGRGRGRAMTMPAWVTKQQLHERP